MPAVTPWSAKYAPDPADPGYVKIVGSYAADFLLWAKLIGAPAWDRKRTACVLGREIVVQHKKIEVQEGGELVVVEPEISFRVYWPLEVLEPIFEGILKAKVVGGLIINDEQKFYLR